jgi:type VI secretion system secreted protein Hcp
VFIGALGHYATEKRDGLDRWRPYRRTAELTEIVFNKIADLSSPILMQTCASGRTIPKAKFEFMRADSNGERIKYFEIELENVLTGEIRPGVDPGDFLSEHVGLKFSKVKWKYTQQKVSGGSGGNTSGGWDLSGNKIV